MVLHGEGGEVEKNDLDLLFQLEELGILIDTYDPKNVNTVDKTGLFYK